MKSIYLNSGWCKAMPSVLPWLSVRPYIFYFAMTLFCLFLSENVFAQEGKKPFLDDFSGTASVTNNGISLIPSFSLGDPALIFDLKFKKGKLSFEPDMRFALEGKPWTFIFWWRYRAIDKERFSLRVGAHPALNFRTISIVRNGRSEEILESRRYWAWLLCIRPFSKSKRTGWGVLNVLQKAIASICR
ncbi:hypothetical protein [Flagellimonas okinawensis]|uniref:7TM-DISM receptor extracellular domain-containing protein n=1 Tax=Flagellimonas okinawensis TaxID=3031324 RepID=A0ABT5XUG8_9FLAO|nr:hypothetical protein [[Muricauda] okinawensis]MDF0709211.1 hypothetical protein [[Muricauda] okinawensis]